MNIHIKPSTSPMRDGPLGRPDKCPACDAPIYHDPLDVLFIGGENHCQFQCGLTMVWHDVPPIGAEVKRPCSRASPIDTCLRLRAELETQHKATDDLWNERTQLQAENELQQKNITFKAKQLVELRAELDAARRSNDVFRHNNMIQSSEIITLAAQLDAARAEVAAYKKAKSENDERFMLERDSALARAEKAEAQIADAVKELGGNWSTKFMSAMERAVKERGDLIVANAQFQAELATLRARAAELQARLGAAALAAQAVAGDVCSLLCPSVKKTETEWTHHPKCIALRAALADAPAVNLSDLRGIAPDAGGSLSSEEFISQLRSPAVPAGKETVTE